jgi:transposase
LFSYTGLTPSEHSSGDSIRRGSITKQGNRQVRAILIEVAWRAMEKDNNLATFFARISARSGSKRAIVAVARKLIGRIRAAFRHNTLYQVGNDPGASPATSVPLEEIAPELDKRRKPMAS